MKYILLGVFSLALCETALSATFSLARDYSGNGFFDAWDFYGNYDNLTNGACV